MDLLQRFGRLDEDHVGAGLDIAFGARDGGIETFHSDRVGARDDQRVVVGQRLARDADLAAHFPGVDQALVVQVAAALGKGLVLDVEGGHAGALHRAHGALHVGRAAKPVSASATTGRPPASTIFSTRSITSLKLSRPMSG